MRRIQQMSAVKDREEAMFDQVKRAEDKMQ